MIGAYVSVLMIDCRRQSDTSEQAVPGALESIKWLNQKHSQTLNICHLFVVLLKNALHVFCLQCLADICMCFACKRLHMLHEFHFCKTGRQQEREREKSSGSRMQCMVQLLRSPRIMLHWSRACMLGLQSFISMKNLDNKLPG